MHPSSSSPEPQNSVPRLWTFSLSTSGEVNRGVQTVARQDDDANMKTTIMVSTTIIIVATMEVMIMEPLGKYTLVMVCGTNAASSAVNHSNGVDIFAFQRRLHKVLINSPQSNAVSSRCMNNACVESHRCLEASQSYGKKKLTRDE